MPPDRFRVATPLPPDGGWRSELALDREALPPRPVTLGRVPASVSGDAMGLASLARGVDLAARLQHPSILPVLGLIELGGGLVVVGAFREGETLRAVLDAGGPLSAPLASRVVGDVARAIHAIHRLSAGNRPFAHGAVRPEQVLIAEDGTVLLTGLGRPTEPTATPPDDLRALPRLLAECLAPGSGGGGIPPELAPFAVEPAGVEPPREAEPYADALAAAAPPAAPSALVARVDSALPKGAAARASRRRALAQALLAEAGGGEGPALTPTPQAVLSAKVQAPPPVVAGNPATPPALTPPPFRGPPAGPPQVRTPGPPPGTASVAPPAASRAAAPPPASIASASPPKPTTAPPRVLPGAPAAPAAGAQASLLDDPRLPQYAGVVFGLAGFLIGFLAGRR